MELLIDKLRFNKISFYLIKYLLALKSSKDIIT